MMRTAIAAALFAMTVASADAAMVKCTKPDGSLYIGPTPPKGCEVSGAVRGATAAGSGGSLEEGRGRALAACHNGVRERLKSPGSAQFPPVKSVVDQGGWNFKFDGAVDAQNAMGGLLRSDYTCWATYDGHDEWKVAVFLSGQAQGRLSDFGAGGSRQRVSGDSP